MTDTLWTALLAAQTEVRGIAPAGNNPRFGKHVKLDDVLDKVVPALNKHGLILTQNPSAGVLHTKIIHAPTGERYEVEPMDLLIAKADSQGQGSAITYARRYSLMAIMALKGDKDDDGEAAQGDQPDATANPGEPPPGTPPAPRGGGSPGDRGAHPSEGQITELNRVFDDIQSLYAEHPILVKKGGWNEVKANVQNWTPDGASKWIDHGQAILNELRAAGVEAKERKPAAPEPESHIFDPEAPAEPEKDPDWVGVPE